MEEPREVEDFTYVWDQQAFDPLPDIAGQEHRAGRGDHQGPVGAAEILRLQRVGRRRAWSWRRAMGNFPEIRLARDD